MSNIEKLEQLISQIDPLINQFVDSTNPRFCAWKEQCVRFLIKVFGESSHELKTFNGFPFTLLFFTSDTPNSSFNQACVDDLLKVKAVFQTYLEEMKESQQEEQNENVKNPRICRTKVFIVHGHDGELKQSVARIVEKAGLTAVILNEQPSGGATIIEKIEKNSDVGAAICLFTADDKCINEIDGTTTMRARQNVVFEAGYFIGKLKRENVILLADKGIEMPSDLGGVVYTDTANWQFSVCAELKRMGFEIDLNRLV